MDQVHAKPIVERTETVAIPHPDAEMAERGETIVVNADDPRAIAHAKSAKGKK